MAAGVSILNDLPYPMCGACTVEIITEMDTANARIPTAKYTKMGETLRHVIPGHMQCSMACGGKACKYENPSRWSDEEQAIKGLYSSWITDNLLAMARPSTEIIQKYNIIEQFQRCGLKTVINLQRPGEHASCGNSLEQESGFTYRPETFMRAGIYYYNFGWKDYGVASLTTILDMVKVMSFAIQEGKLAVHCHAGLGRTGVLLACYLVFTSRMNADQAILFVRAKRPNSIQTRGQLLCVREFAQFLVPLRSVFSSADPKASAVTLSQYLTRQSHLLHGYEARQMKHVPKIVQLACQLLVDVAADRQVVIEEEWLEIPDLTAEVEKTVSQQALQQLGKEMRGKGIPVPPCSSSHPVSASAQQSRPPQDQPSDNELDPLWQEQNVESPLKSSLSDKRSLSYSDSVLHKPRPQQYHLENLKSYKPINCLNKYSFSHSSLTGCNTPRNWDLSPQDIISIIQDPMGDAKKDAGSSSSRRKLHKWHQSLSLDLSEQRRKSYCYATHSALSTKSKLVTRETKPDVDVSVDEGVATVPFITLQPELSAEGRHLLVAKALAMDLTDNDLTSKVLQWQTELNTREGAWERLCMERDPLVLSGLMWSWLEQLKGPVISSEDIKALSEKNVNPEDALNSLEKGHRLTLLCILQCAAHVLPMPEEVETSFLNQTIKVFTKIDPASEKNESLYTKLKAILAPILHELRDKAVEENEDS
ncbi:protein tyrosine phosphatase domain-containing protein 1 isoform X2 [Labrus bergylta]|uniref:Protein tyrosine phosphatase domain-containing protein 1 n=1 Tax=Labrus bergylta TaxID=56723 RepID=A0A3Q3LNZ1_9LABR|nr:protein tyrosine phosphatase domain-containing protein 1-like [Labrus bergylta]XP_020502995.1 protein tyrosine phosphatase domain-containing protein 1-like [Labrus bergylta]